MNGEQLSLDSGISTLTHTHPSAACTSSCKFRSGQARRLSSVLILASRHGDSTPILMPELPKAQLPLKNLSNGMNQFAGQK